MPEAGIPINPPLIFTVRFEKVAFRVNGAYETAESRDVVESQKYYFNPSFSILVKSHSLLLKQMIENEFTPDFGIEVPSKTEINHIALILICQEMLCGCWLAIPEYRAGYGRYYFNHQLSEFWTLNTVASFQNYTKDYFSTERVTWTYDNANRLKWQPTCQQNL